MNRFGTLIRGHRLCWFATMAAIVGLTPRQALADSTVKLSQPAPGATIPAAGTAIVFTWEAPAGGAREYEFRLALKDANTAFLVQTVKARSFEFRCHLPALATPWIWKVRARLASGEYGAWSEDREFSIRPTGQTAVAGLGAGSGAAGLSEVANLQPKPSSPAAGGTVSQAERVWRFAWSSPGDTRPVRLYQLRVHMRGAQKPFVNAAVVGEQCAIPLDTAPLVAEWRWTVRPVGRDGSLGPWSSESSFSVTIGGQVASQRRPARIGRAAFGPGAGLRGGSPGMPGFGGEMGSQQGVYLGEFDSINQLASQVLGMRGNFFGYATLRR
jgi:hypothetical protein